MARVVARTSSKCQCCGTAIAGFGCSGLTGESVFRGFRPFNSPAGSYPPYYRVASISGSDSFIRHDGTYALSVHKSSAIFQKCNTGGNDTWTPEEGFQWLATYPGFGGSTISAEQGMQGFAGVPEGAEVIGRVCFMGWSGGGAEVSGQPIKYFNGSSCQLSPIGGGGTSIGMGTVDTMQIAMENGVCRGGAFGTPHEDCCTYTSSWSDDPLLMYQLGDNAYQKFSGQSLQVRVTIIGAQAFAVYTVTFTFIETVYSSGAAVGSQEVSVTLPAPGGVFDYIYDAPTPEPDRKLCLESIEIEDGSGEAVTLEPRDGGYYGQG